MLAVIVTPGPHPLRLGQRSFLVPVEMVVLTALPQAEKLMITVYVIEYLIPISYCGKCGKTDIAQATPELAAVWTTTCDTVTLV